MVRSLEDVRKECGYTQEQMALYLKIAASTYNQYENGARNVPSAIAEAAATILNVSVDDIFLPSKFTISKLSG